MIVDCRPARARRARVVRPNACARLRTAPVSLSRWIGQRKAADLGLARLPSCSISQPDEVEWWPWAQGWVRFPRGGKIEPTQIVQEVPYVGYDLGLPEPFHTQRANDHAPRFAKIGGVIREVFRGLCTCVGGGFDRLLESMHAIVVCLSHGSRDDRDVPAGSTPLPARG